MEFILEKDYKPLKDENIGFGLKQKIQLFKSGFKNSSKGLLSFLFFLLFWMFLGFSVSFLGYDTVKNWYAMNQKVFLQTTDFIDYLMATLFFILFAFSYNSNQYITSINLIKNEKTSEDYHQLRKFFHKIFSLFFTIILTGIILFITLFFLGDLYGDIVENYGNIDNFFNQAGIIKIIAYIFLVFVICSVIYFNNLTCNILFITELNHPISKNFFKNYIRSFYKGIKIFNLIIPTIFLHVIISCVVMAIAFNIGIKIYDYFYEYYNIAEMLKSSLAENTIKANILEYQVKVGSVFLAGSLFLVVFSFFNRARIRSLLLIVLLTENFEEYKQRIIKPTNN